MDSPANSETGRSLPVPTKEELRLFRSGDLRSRLKSKQQYADRCGLSDLDSYMAWEALKEAAMKEGPRKGRRREGWQHREKNRNLVRKYGYGPT